MKRIFFLFVFLLQILIAQGALVFDYGDFSFEVLSEETGTECATVKCLGLNVESAANHVSTIIIPSVIDVDHGSGSTKRYVVKEIASKAFWNNTDLTGVSIQPGIETIGTYAFQACIKLHAVFIPSTVSKIGVGAFTMCSRLTDVRYYAHKAPSEEVGDIWPSNEDMTLWVPECMAVRNAYQNNNNYRMFTVKGRADAVDLVSNNLQMNFVSQNWKTGQHHVTIVGGSGATIRYDSTDKNIKVISIQPYAFYNHSDLTSVEITAITKDKNSVVGASAFENCENLRTVSVNFSELLGCSFKNCTSLTEMNLNEGVEAITGAEVFCGAGLSKLKLPKSFVFLDNADTFSKSNLAAFEVAEGNEKGFLADSLGVLYQDFCLCCFPPALKLQDYTPLAKTKIVGYAAFSGAQITELNLPYGLEKITSFAFSGSSIQRLTIPQTIKTVEEFVFHNFGSLKTLVINKPLNEIEQFSAEAFNYFNYSRYGHLRVVVPRGAEVEYNNLFTKVMSSYYGAGLSIYNSSWDFQANEHKVFIDAQRGTKTYKSCFSIISDESFVDYVDGKSIVCRGKVELSHQFQGIETLDSKQDAEYDRNWTLNVPDYVTLPNDSAVYKVVKLGYQFLFGERYTQAYPRSPMHQNYINSITGCNKIEEISGYAFSQGPTTANSVAKYSLTLPSVVKIGAYAFADSKLSSISFGDKLKFIGAGAFSGSAELNNELILPYGVEEIAENAFKGINVHTILIPSSVKKFALTSICKLPSAKKIILNIPNSASLFTDEMPFGAGAVTLNSEVKLYVPTNGCIHYTRDLSWAPFHPSMGAYDFVAQGQYFTITDPKIDYDPNIGIYSGKVKYVYSPDFSGDFVPGQGNVFKGRDFVEDYYITVDGKEDKKRFVITEIEDSCMFQNQRIQKVDLGEMNHLQRIGHFAFWNCGNITGEIVVPSTCDFVGNSAFQGCTNLNELTILSKSIAFGIQNHPYIPNYEYGLGNSFFGNNANNFACNIYWTRVSKLREFAKTWNGADWIKGLFTSADETQLISVPYPVDWSSSGLTANIISDYNKNSNSLTAVKVSSTPASEGVLLVGYAPESIYKLKEGENVTAITNNMLVGTPNESKKIFDIEGAYKYYPKSSSFKRAQSNPEDGFSFAGSGYLQLRQGDLGFAGDQITIDNIFKLGDVNGDNEVDVADVLITANYAIGKSVSPFNYNAANVNGDDEVDVADVILIAKISIGQQVNLNQAPRVGDVVNRMTMNDFSIKSGEETTIDIALDNGIDITAFQMDLSLPKGVVLEKASLTPRTSENHTLVYNKKSDEKICLMSYAISGEKILGNEGAILTLTLKAENGFNGSGSLELSNIKLAENNGIIHKLENTFAQISGITGVCSVGSDVNVYSYRYSIVIDSPIAADVQIISTNGMAHNLHVGAGRSTLNVNNHGLYIVRIAGKTYKVII